MNGTALVLLGVAGGACLGALLVVALFQRPWRPQRQRPRAIGRREQPRLVGVSDGDVSELEWWELRGSDLLAVMRRCHAGERPDLVYAELHANALRSRE